MLFVHGPRNVGGDTTALLNLIEGLDVSRIEPLIAASPDCEAWRRLAAVTEERHLRLFPLEMGVSDTEAMPEHPSREATGLATIFALAKLVWLIVRHHVDVVYTLDRSRSPLFAAIAARLLRRKMVFHAHYPYFIPTHRGGSAVVKSATRVVAVSDFVKRAYVGFGIAPERIQTIYNGIDVDSYEAGAVPVGARAEPGTEPNEPVVLLPGRLSRYKGQLELVEAMPAILQTYPSTTFVFAGYDSTELGDLAEAGHSTMLPILQHRVAELGVAARARFLGMTGDMARLYASADVVVVPTWEEPFGLVVVEAMAAGRALVASDAGGIPEIVHSGETGILVPPRNPTALAGAIKRLLADPSLRLMLGEAAHRDVHRRFIVARYCREFEDLVATIAQGDRIDLATA